LTGRREEDDFRWWEAYVPAYETRNGQMWREANQSAGGLAARLTKIAIAGSDSHTTAGVGLTYTEVPGARSVEEFFAGLRAGQGRVKGEHGSYGKLTADVFRIIRSLFLEKPWTVMLSPLAVFVPVITMGHWVNEMRFCRKWTTALENSQPSKRIRWNMHSSFEGNWAS